MRAQGSLETGVLALFPYPFVLTGSRAVSDWGDRGSLFAVRDPSCAFPSLSHAPGSPWASAPLHAQPLPAAWVQHRRRPTPCRGVRKAPGRRACCQDGCWGQGAPRSRVLQTLRSFQLCWHTLARSFPGHLGGCSDQQGLELPPTMRSRCIRKLCQLFKEARCFALRVGGSGRRFLNSAERSSFKRE